MPPPFYKFVPNKDITIILNKITFNFTTVVTKHQLQILQCIPVFPAITASILSMRVMHCKAAQCNPYRCSTSISIRAFQSRIIASCGITKSRVTATMIPRVYGNSITRNKIIRECGEWTTNGWEWRRAWFEWELPQFTEFRQLLNQTQTQKEWKDLWVWKDEEQKFTAYLKVKTRFLGKNSDMFNLFWSIKELHHHNIHLEGNAE